MAAVWNHGDMKYWIDGQAWSGVKKEVGAEDQGTIKFWLNAGSTPGGYDIFPFVEITATPQLTLLGIGG